MAKTECKWHPIVAPLVLTVKALVMMILAGGVAQAAQDVLPTPDPVFKGTALESVAQSRPDWPVPDGAPQGAPNIVLVMTDDVGFGASSTFGGSVPTPALDRLADSGLRYNNFHTTAMCSPTRAALLTGRNHHRVGYGALSNIAMGFPGYWSELPHSAATVARVLGDNGYGTAFFGKHHNAPDWADSSAGPFDQWPTGRWGFDYFFGFLAADTDQWNPRLYRNTVPVNDPESDELLDKRLVDDAIHWLHNQKANFPERPFFLYLAPGTAHAPLHAPGDWIARFKGKFDHGWDQERERVFRQQKAEGVIPDDAVLTPRPSEIPPWDSLSKAEQRLYARYMEAYAATLAYQDFQFGRLLGELERIGESENTLVIFIEGDNGGSGEGGMTGSFNELLHLVKQQEESIEYQLANIDTIGGAETYPAYPAGWGWAMNTPFPYTKQLASHLGGTRNGLVVSWPGRLADGGGVRGQYHHVNDVMPTIFEAARVKIPEKVDGIDQLPLDGTSLVYTFNDPKADDRHRTQYYELLGNRAIYHDGWLANTTPGRMPWQTKSPIPPEDFGWELYHLAADYSQSRNLAEQEPEKLRELRELWEQEAERNHVYPLRASLDFETSARMGRPKALRDLWEFWGPDISLPWRQQPVLTGQDFSLTADLDLSSGDSGVLLATGSFLGGWVFYIDEGRPVVEHARSHEPRDRYRIAGSGSLPGDQVSVVFEFLTDKSQLGSGGTMTIRVNGDVVATGQVDATSFMPNGPSETMDVGFDAGGKVSNAYQGNGRFRGVIRHMAIRTNPVESTP